LMAASSTHSPLPVLALPLPHLRPDASTCISSWRCTAPSLSSMYTTGRAAEPKSARRIRRARPAVWAVLRADREYLDWVLAARPIDPDVPVLAPGDPEAAMRAARLAEGIPLRVDTWAAIRRTAQGLGITTPA
jgi:hypothetical protein